MPQALSVNKLTEMLRLISSLAIGHKTNISFRSVSVKSDVAPLRCLVQEWQVYLTMQFQLENIDVFK